MHIENAKRLTTIFDHWPSFHDAEVLRVGLDRSGADGPVLTMTIYLFGTTSEVDSRGYFILKNHVEVTLSFTRVSDLSIEEFNHQNVLMCMQISEIDPSTNDGRSIRIKMRSSYGANITFNCDRLKVTDVQPCRLEWKSTEINTP